MHDQPTTNTQHQLQFTGSGSEYFRIWIVNILLTVVTLYIYSAWAKVRTRRYFYGNTVLDGSAFEYHATGKQLLPGRLIGLVLILMIAFGESLSIAVALAGYGLIAVLAPWALCRSRQFNARMSSYRNIRFGFSGKAWKFYEYIMLMPFIPMLFIGTIAVALFYSRVITQGQAFFFLPVAVFTLYAMAPWILGKLARYSLNNSLYGTAQFSTGITAGRYASVYYKAIAFSIGLFILLGGIIIGAATLFAETVNIDPEALTNPDSLAAYGLLGSLYLVLIPVSTLIKAYIACRVRNYQLNNTTLDRKFNLNSNVTTIKLWGLELTNLLLIVLTLGLGYPWAAIRKARFMANHTQVTTSHNADQFVADQGYQVSAVGDEIGDAFDMDIAAGF